MSRLTKLAAGAFIVFGVVSFFGPLLIAVLATMFALNLPPDPWPTRSEGEKLVSAYRENERNKFQLTSMSPLPEGAECGYEPSELFPGDGLLKANEKQKFTNYWGYFVLSQWRDDFEWNVSNAAIAEKLDESVDQFQLGFLRRCITTTLARGICMSQIEELVHSAGDKIDLRPRGEGSIHYGTTKDIVCIYADGVAARTGIPLQSREKN